MAAFGSDPTRWNNWYWCNSTQVVTLYDYNSTAVGCSRCGMQHYYQTVNLPTFINYEAPSKDALALAAYRRANLEKSWVVVRELARQKWRVRSKDKRVRARPRIRNALPTIFRYYQS